MSEKQQPTTTDAAAAASTTGPIPGEKLIPGEILCAPGDIELNPGQKAIAIEVLNAGDRPIQVGSHVHFAQANVGLQFDRDAAYGRRLEIPAGTAVRFEPGIAQTVDLVEIRGSREVYGLSMTPPGKLDS